MTYGHLRADCLYTRISCGPNACYRVRKAFTFTFTVFFKSLVKYGMEEYIMVHTRLPYLALIGEGVDSGAPKLEQEGQHPLTGQRTANFRLLANQ